MPSIFFISVLFMGLGMLVQFRLKSKFAAYAKVPTGSGLSGKEIAEKMLYDNGIYEKAKDALKWAALAYVVAALASIAMLVQYILIYQNRRD